MTKAKLKRIILTAFIGAVAVLLSGCSKEEAYRLVKVQSYDGAVTVQREEKLNAFEGLQLISNDTVSVGDKSFLELLADSDKHIAAEGNTGFVLHSTGDENSGDITIDLLYGKSLFTIDNKLNESSTFDVNTPNATLSVRGTSFSAAYDEETKTTNVEVYSGTVQLNSGDEELLIEKDGIATITTTDEGVKIITSNEASAGNPNAISIPENTEKLFEIAMKYPQQEDYSTLNAEYYTSVSDFTAKETGISDNDIVFQKFIELIKNHNEEIAKFFEENKANAVANTNKQQDVTDWFKEKITVGDKEFRIDKAIMDMSIYGSNIKKKYITSDTYKVNTEGVDMYFCANGVEISFYGGFEKVTVVTTTTTTTTTTTVPETTVPETTTVETTTMTAATTTTAPVTTTTTTTKATTTTKKADSNSKRYNISIESYDYSVYFNMPQGYELHVYENGRNSAGYKTLTPINGTTKYNSINVSFYGNGEFLLIYDLENKGHTSDDNFVYELVEKYTCLIGEKSGTGTVYIAEEIPVSDDENSDRLGAKKYGIFVDFENAKHYCVIVEKQWGSAYTHSLSSDDLFGETKDVIEFVKEMFPPC